jgi:hypothetical protein
MEAGGAISYRPMADDGIERSASDWTCAFLISRHNAANDAL